MNSVNELAKATMDSEGCPKCQGDVIIGAEAVPGGFLMTTQCGNCDHSVTRKDRYSFADEKINKPNLLMLASLCIDRIRNGERDIDSVESFFPLKHEDEDLQRYMASVLGNVLLNDHIFNSFQSDNIDAILQYCVLLADKGERAFDGDGGWVWHYPTLSLYPSFDDLMDGIHPNSLYRIENGKVKSYTYVKYCKGCTASILGAYYEDNNGNAVRVDTAKFTQLDSILATTTHDGWFITRQMAEDYNSNPGIGGSSGGAYTR